MQSFELKKRLAGIPSPLFTAHLLCFKNWEDPEDFYTMGIVERRKLMAKMKPVSVDPTPDNCWIWFGAYDSKNYPKFAKFSVPSFLYQLIISPHNNARIMAMLNSTRSDVNPYKYHKAMKMTRDELLNYRADMMDKPLAEVATQKQSDQFEKKVEACLEDIKGLYEPNSPTAELEFMKTGMHQLGHMPLAVDEAIARSGLEFK